MASDPRTCAERTILQRAAASCHSALRRRESGPVPGRGYNRPSNKRFGLQQAKGARLPAEECTRSANRMMPFECLAAHGLDQALVRVVFVLSLPFRSSKVINVTRICLCAMAQRKCASGNELYVL